MKRCTYRIVRLPSGRFQPQRKRWWGWQALESFEMGDGGGVRWECPEPIKRVTREKAVQDCHRDAKYWMAPPPPKAQAVEGFELDAAGNKHKAWIWE